MAEINALFAAWVGLGDCTRPKMLSSHLRLAKTFN